MRFIKTSRYITSFSVKRINNVDITKEPQTIISLCTGMRGLERGLERTGINLRTLCYVEIEAFICENLVQQMEQGVLDEAPIWSNLKTFPWKDFHGKVHGITGGYPCQPFSIAGKQLGTEDPRHLWPYIKDGIQAIRPVWCFFENVPGHINIGYREVRSDLEVLGYKVEEGIFSAEEVGAPHQRKRLFILAIMANTCCESIRNSKGGLHTSSSHTSTKMEYSTEQGFSQSGSSTKRELSEEEGKRMDDRFEQSSNRTEPNVANSQSERIRGLSECKQGQERSISIKSHDVNWQSKRDELANTNNTGSQGRNREELQECSGECTARTSSTQAWPARPGQCQHAWEPPRTKSRMGFMLNGYSFREDLLRMAGNGVVEQTAEKAFITLLQKHINNGRSNPT